MGSSSGSGSYVFGGTSSSSTLSPLAPPFNFDKLYTKPKLMNSSTNLFETPVYGSVFDSAGPFWNASSGSRPNYVGTESLGANTSCPTSPGIYSYPVSQSSNSQTSGYADLKQLVSCDPFSYSHFQVMTTSADEAAKPYYPSYVYPPPSKDGYLGLGNDKGPGPGYDLLSSSDSANCDGYGSSLIDHTQGLSVGGNSDPKWGFFCTGVDAGEHNTWKEYDQGFGSNGINLSGLSTNKSHLSVDVSDKSHPFVDGAGQSHPFTEGSNDCLLKQGSCLTQGLDCHINASTHSDNYYDLFGATYPALSLGIGHQDYKSSFDLNLGSISTDCSKQPAFVSGSAFDEIPHLQVPILESVTSFCAAQPATGSTSKGSFNQTGSFVFSCTSTNSTPITVSKLPYGGSNFTGQSTLSGAKLNNSDAIHKSVPSAGCYSFGQKESLVSPGSIRQSSITIKRPLSFIMVPSPTQTGEVVNRHVDKDASNKTKLTPQVPHSFIMNGFGLETDDAEVIYSVEKHSGESDNHNPAEDSPCWKGASSSRFSPFGVPDSESVVSVALVDNLDGDNSPSAQETQNKTFLVDASQCIDFSSEKVNEKTSMKRPSVSSYTWKDHEDGLMSQRSHCFDLNNGAEIHYVDECHVYTEELNVVDKTKTDSDSSLVSRKIRKDGDASFERNISEASEAEKNEDCTPLASYSFSGIPLNIGNNLCSSPPGDNSSLKHCQSLGKVSDSRVDIDVLLKTMMNLSEVFRSYCFDNPAIVMQQHSETIRRIIDNLTTSLLMTHGPFTPSILVSSQDTSIQKNKLPASEMVGTPESAAAVKLSRRTEDFLASFPFKDDLSPLGNDNMIAAVKKILIENIQEEMDQDEHFYKNLWLESEAALCAMIAKARLHHVKVEMEKTYSSTKDKGKLPNSNISSHVDNILESTSKDKSSPALVVRDLASPRTSATSQCEVSIINKFHIPNSQVSLNSKKCDGPKTTREEVCFPSLPTSSNNCDDSGTTSIANDLATSVAARYQILKDRTDQSNNLDYEGELSQSDDNCLLEKDYSSLETFGPNSNANDVETSALARYQMIKSRDDRADSPSSEGEQSPAELNLPDNVFSDSDKPFQQFQLFKSVAVTDDCEASVMGRFRILQSRIDGLNTTDKDRTPAQEPDWSKQVGQSFFGPYPDFSMYENVKDFDICMNGEAASTHSFKPKVFEGWYDNGYSSEWEHVSKEDVQRQC